MTSGDEDEGVTEQAAAAADKSRLGRGPQPLRLCAGRRFLLSSLSVMGSAYCAGAVPVAAAQVVLERANQHRSKIGPFVHGPDLRGPPQLPRELDGRFHRVAVSPLCRQYGLSSVTTYTAKRQDIKTVNRVHIFTLAV